ncbi:hypothetical protein B1F77_00065 [Pseudomonas syringae]|nr:hypothetical protein B1F77_00065 [Pseudomonas syringae]
MPFWTLHVLLTTQSVENCIPTLEGEERSSQHRADAPRFCPKGVGVSLLTKGAVQARLSCGVLRRMPSANKKPR